MNLLVINYEYPPIGGGGGFVTRDILEHMAELGHKVSIITSGYKGLKARENINGVDVIRVPVLFRSKKEVASLPSMLSFVPSCILKAILGLDHHDYDIINTHFAIPSGPAGFFLKNRWGIPNVLSIHGGDIYDPSKSLSPHNTPFLHSTVRTMLNKADCVVAQSNDTKKNATKYYNLDRPVQVIPLGIKKPSFTKKPRNDFGFKDEEFLFCTIGRLVSRKNIDAALSILSPLNGKYPFKFIIIGEGPERIHIEKCINNLDLQGHVRLMGNVSDGEKFQILSLSDFYLSTALHEGFGLVFLEAMECGLPVISYNQGGQNDFLINGKTGFLVKLGEKESFRDRINEVI